MPENVPETSESTDEVILEETTQGEPNDLDPKDLLAKIDKLEKEVKIAKDGQRGSAKEYKRVQQELDQLKNQQESARNTNPKTIFEAVGVNPEDALFDFEEAVKNESSDSGKVLDARIAVNAVKILKRLLDERDNKRSQEEFMGEIKNQRTVLAKKLGVNEQEIDEWMENRKDRKFTLEEIYDLDHPDSLLKKAKEVENIDKQKQRQRVGNLPNTLANQSGRADSPDVQDALIKFLKKSINPTSDIEYVS